MRSINIPIIALCFFLGFLLSCKKYLDAKPDKSLVVPTTVQDLQGILDNWRYMNVECSELSEIASDNYYLTDNSYLGLPNDYSRDAYIWTPGMFVGVPTVDWTYEYNVVYNANIVLDNIDNIAKDPTTISDWNYCKGSALLFRAKAFYEIAQIWCKAYDENTAGSDLGIPLRLTSDFNAPSVRATLKDTYSRIITDLQNAALLLPTTPPAHPYRPYKAAAYGFLMRTYLSMRAYDKAKLYADSCLQLNNQIEDFNELDATSSYPFAAIKFTNPEDIFHTSCPVLYYDLYRRYSRIDSALYASYDSNDLRKEIYFKNNPDGSVYFRGSYNGIYTNFNGLATDEIYLTRAECLARGGNVASAMEDLNSLLIKRWVSGAFTPFTAINPTDALQKILTERRKELLMRMLRFTDIKRLNKEGANISITRLIQGQRYTLSPNDPRFALPIPDVVIKYTGMQQN